jgi:hypothetical protein
VYWRLMPNYVPVGVFAFFIDVINQIKMSCILNNLLIMSVTVKKE